MERALAVARARDSERQQFHKRYVFDLTDPAVTQIELITEFRVMFTLKLELVPFVLMPSESKSCTVLFSTVTVFACAVERFPAHSMK